MSIFKKRSIWGRIKGRFRSLFQRLRWGFSDDELWNLDRTIAKFILPRIKRFKKFRNGYPDELLNGDWNEEREKIAVEQWDKILDNMIECFEIIVSDDFFCPSVEQELKIKEGLKLFSKYFMHLWI